VHAGFHRILEFAVEINIKKDRDFEEFEGKIGLKLSSSEEWMPSYLARIYREPEWMVEFLGGRNVDICEPLDLVELSGG
jgi:hypothetical protein